MSTLSNNTINDKSMNGLVTIDANSISTDELDVDTLVVNLSATAPTVSALSNDTNIATTAWVTNHAGGGYVTLATTQTVTGEKTFSNANTYISGNTVTNNIVSALPTSNIAIGSALTTGDILLGNSSGATNVALNWGGSSNSGNLSFQGGSFTLASTGVYTQRSGPTFDMTIGDTQTSGVLNIGTGSSRTGNINIGTGSSIKTITLGAAVSSSTTNINGGTINITGTGGTNMNITNTGDMVILNGVARGIYFGTNKTGSEIIIGQNQAVASTTRIDIGIGSLQTGGINIGSGCVGNAPIVIGSSASTTQTCTMNGLTTFSKIPSCAVAPTSANHLVNKNYVDSGAFVNLTTNQTIAGIKTFSSDIVVNGIDTVLATDDLNLGSNITTGAINLATTSSTFSALNWGSASNTAGLLFQGGEIDFRGSENWTQRCGLTYQMNIADTQTSGPLTLGIQASRSGAININTGLSSTAAVSISSMTTLNAPITIGSSSSTTQTCTMNGLTTFNKLMVVADGILQRWGGSSTGLTLGKTNTNEITCKLLNSSDTLYFQTSTGSSIMYMNSTEIINSIPTTFSSTTTHTGAATFNNDILVQQSTYPSTNTSALGYNKTETLAEFTFTADTFGTIGSFTVPSKGVWICNIICNYRTTGGAGSFENVRLILTVGSTDTTAYRTFEYFDETDVIVGTNGKRFVHTISGTLTTTASQTYYIRGLNDTTGITTFGEATYSYTRVG